MAIKASVALLVLPALTMPALAQTWPPQLGGVLTNPEAPKPLLSANPTGQPPLPTFIPPAILMPGGSL